MADVVDDLDLARIDDLVLFHLVGEACRTASRGRSRRRRRSRRSSGTAPGRWSGGRRSRSSDPVRARRCPGSGRAPSAGVAVSVPWTTTSSRSIDRDLDPPDALAVLDPVGEKVGEQPRPARRLSPTSVGALDLGELGNSASSRSSESWASALLDRAVDGRDRLLPGERHGDVDEDHDAGRDQRDREDVQRPAHALT